MLKKCCKCKRDLPLFYFNKHTASKDGLYPRCKECRGFKITNTIEGHKICFSCNRELPLTNEFFHRANRNKNGFTSRCRECIKKYSSHYYLEKRNKILERCKIYNKTNKEKISKYYKIYCKSSKERVRKSNYKKTNKDKTNLNTQKRRNAKKNLISSFTYNDWLVCRKFFNNKCAYCGKSKVLLTQEHFIPITKGGNYTKDNIIPVCLSCNSSKNNSDFSKWYKVQTFYNKENEMRIYNYFKLIKGGALDAI